MPKSFLFAFMVFIVLSCKQETPTIHKAASDSTQIKIDNTPKALEGSFVHTVFFWLNKDSSPEDVTQFEKNLDKFIQTNIHIHEMHIGKPAMTDRAVVDNSYSYSLVTTFKSKKEHDAYQEDQMHLDFIEQSKHLWERVQVYDSISN